MKMPITPNRNFLKRLKRSQQIRVMMKRQPTTASGRAESGIRPLVANRGRASK